jgi:hypothetical protein
VPGFAQLGALAGTVAMPLAGLAARDLVVGSGEDCAAGETEVPAETSGWAAGWAAAFPDCPASAETRA